MPKSFHLCISKHVAIGNGKIVGLYLNDRTHDSEDAVDATIEVIDRNSEDFENSTKFPVSLNIKPEEVLVCGDSGNDLTRFSKFPHSFARSQASDSFKAKANHVIKHVCDLQKYLDNPELMENDTIKN